MKVIPGMKGNKSSSKFLLLVLTIFIVFGSLFLITSALGVKYTYSNQLWDGTAKSSCSTCGMMSSDQYVYYPSSEGYSQSVSSGYIFTKTFVLEDYVNYNDMSRYYEKYTVYLLDKATNEILYNSGERTFQPRLTSGSTSVSESFSAPITKSRVVQLMIVGSKANSYGIFYEMEYNTGHRPTWAFFVNGVVPQGFSCGGSFICPTGYYCSNGSCLPMADINSNPSATQCLSSSSCPTGYTCLNGVCQTNAIPSDYNKPITVITDPASSGPVTIIPVTTTPSSSSTSPTGNTVTEPDNTDDGNDVVDNSWFEEGLADMFPVVTSPSLEKFSVANYKLTSPQYIIFSGCGPDEGCGESSFYFNDDFNNPNNPWYRGVAEEIPPYKTVGYEWDMNADGVADYKTKSCSHTFTLPDGATEKEITVRFRVKMENTKNAGQYGYSQPVELKFLLVDRDAYSFPNLPCDEYAKDYAIGGKAVEGLVYLGCIGAKFFFYVMNLPYLITANIYYALTSLCIGSYAGLLANSLPVILIVLFLLTCLVPDDIVGAIMGAVLTFILGTTAPAYAIASVPIIAWVAGSAVLPGFMTEGSIVSSAKIGGGAIIIGLVILCLWHIFANIDTSKVIKVDGSGKNTGLKITDNISFTEGGIRGIRKLLAELVLITIGLMYIECKLGQPVYSLTIQFINALPSMLEQLAKVMF